MFPLAGAMYKAARGGSARNVYTIGGVTVAVVAIFMIAYLSLATDYNSTLNEDNYSLSVNTFTVNDIHLALDVFYFIASLLAIAELGTLLLMMRDRAQLGSLKVLIPLLGLALLGNSITDLVIVVRDDFENVYPEFGAYITQYVFLSLLNACVFLFLLFIGETSIMRAVLNDPTMINKPAYQPNTAYATQQVPSGAVYAYVPPQGYQQPQYQHPMPGYTQHPMVPGHTGQTYP
jgi:hypothetical protein